MDEQLLIYAAACYGADPRALHPLDGGHVSAVYAFEQAGREYVLRITPPLEAPDRDATGAILAWLAFAAEHGGAVAHPHLSRSGRLIETWALSEGEALITAFEKAPGVRAEVLPPETWTPALYQRLGRVVGRLHRLAAAYRPGLDLRRPTWQQMGNCFNPTEALPSAPQALLTQRTALLAQIHTWNPTPRTYGLIHADLHGGNFYVDVESGTLTLFDFDDCAYGWFLMDTAMQLFDQLVLYSGPDEAAFAERFLVNYLRGYQAEWPLDAAWVERLPLLLKLVEIGVYLQVYRWYDPATSDGWVGRFMAGRQARLAQQRPYVDLAFDALTP